MKTRTRSLALAAVGLLPVLLAVLLYWPTLRLPLIYDTLLHIRIAKGLNLATVWLPTDKFGFYRPLTFFPMLLIRDLLGGYPPLLLHGLNVAQHALNATLVAALAWRLWRDWQRALASGLLLALFPFAYQAVAVYGHNVHPTTANLMLLGLHCYLSGLRERRARWWALTGLLFVLSVLSHETAVLLGPLAALVEWNDRQRSRDTQQREAAGRFLRRPWLWLTILGGLYAIGYQWLPIERVPQGISSNNALWPKALYLLQAAAYPLTWLAHWLPRVGAETLILAAAGVMGALTVWAARRPANRGPLLLGWGWWGLASVLIAVPLQTDYLLHGPRLLYLGGVGLALLWPVLLEPLRRGRGGRWLWAAALVLILLESGSFARGQIARYQELTEPIRRAQAVMQDELAGNGILLVNLPSWLAPARNTFAMGSEHVAMLGPYLFLEELVGQNLGANRPARAIQLPEIQHDAGYPYSLFGEKDLSQRIRADWAPQGSQVLVVSTTAKGVRTEHAGELAPAGDETLLARLGPYELLAARVSACQGAVSVETRWRWTAEQTPPATVSLFVQALDGAGQLQGQADGPPLGLRPNLISLPAGWVVGDRRGMELAAGAQAERLLLGAYDYASGERLAASDAAGRPLADNALALVIAGCPAD